nr:hypothetical protein [Tanacetum cinerariifolium]
GRLGHRRESTFKRLSDTYSPSVTSPGRTWNTLEMIPTVEVDLTNGTLLLAEIVLEADIAPTASKNRMVIPTPLTEQGTNIGDPEDHVKFFKPQHRWNVGQCLRGITCSTLPS